MSDAVQEDGVNLPEPGGANGWAGLRMEREARGLSLSQVSAQLKLTPRQLEAIERGDLSALPGAAFSRGFVRNYARFLQLDPAPLLSLIDASEGAPPAAISAQIYTPSLGRMPTPGNQRFSALPAALMVLLLAGVLGAGWYFQWFEVREEEVLLEEQAESDADIVFRAPFEALTSLSQPSSAQSASSSAVVPGPVASTGSVAANNALQSVSQSAPVVRQSAPPVPQSQLPAVRQSAPAAAQSTPAVKPSAFVNVPPAVASSLPRIVLGFEGESWVEVRDASDKVVFARMNQAGVLQEVQGNGPFALVIGNASKVKLSWKGKPVDLMPYIKGDVARVTVR